MSISNLPNDLIHHIWQHVGASGSLSNMKHASLIGKSFAKEKHEHLHANFIHTSEHYLISRLIHKAVQCSIRQLTDNERGDLSKITEVSINLGYLNTQKAEAAGVKTNYIFTFQWKKQNIPRWTLVDRDSCISKGQQFREEYLEKLPRNPMHWSLLHIIQVFGATSATLFHKLFIIIRHDIQDMISKLCLATTHDKIKPELYTLSVLFKVSKRPDRFGSTFAFINTSAWPGNLANARRRQFKTTAACYLLEKLYESFQRFRDYGNYAANPSKLLLDNKSIFPNVNLQCMSDYYRLAVSQSNINDLKSHIIQRCQNVN